jgi:hypothetical protein
MPAARSGHARKEPVMRWTIPIMLAILLPGAARSAEAATITVTLDDVTETAPLAVWTEAGLNLWFCETTAADLTPGWCLVLPHVELDPYQGVYIFPARLNVDLGGVQGLLSVEVDVYETHFAGSTRAFLYRDGATVAQAQSWTTLTQTLVLPTGGEPVDRLAVSAHESAVWEIRLIGDELTPAARATLGAVKALFRR